ncbi:MAG: bacillithiol system redox-active protein YtxJ [Flavobacteriaceae bacterium]
MGFFEKLFGNHFDNSAESRLAWISLVEPDQLDDMNQKSFEKPQIIYKHSTSCGISSMVLNMFTKGYTLSEEDVDLFFLDIHRNRAISNEIAERYEVRHESPQLLLLKEGKVAVHTSHGAITELDLQPYL